MVVKPYLADMCFIGMPRSIHMIVREKKNIVAGVGHGGAIRLFDFISSLHLWKPSLTCSALRFVLPFCARCQAQRILTPISQARSNTFRQSSRSAWRLIAKKRRGAEVAYPKLLQSQLIAVPLKAETIAKMGKQTGGRRKLPVVTHPDRRKVKPPKKNS